MSRRRTGQAPAAETIAAHRVLQTLAGACVSGGGRGRAGWVGERTWLLGSRSGEVCRPQVVPVAAGREAPPRAGCAPSGLGPPQGRPGGGAEGVRVCAGELRWSAAPSGPEGWVRSRGGGGGGEERAGTRRSPGWRARSRGEGRSAEGGDGAAGGRGRGGAPGRDADPGKIRACSAGSEGGRREGGGLRDQRGDKRTGWVGGGVDKRG